MTAAHDFLAAFDEVFAGKGTVREQIAVLQTTYDALMDTVEEFGDATAEDLNSLCELLVAAIGSTAAALRVLKMHLEDTSSNKVSNPGGLE